MNENKKSAKWYHQFMITALKKKVNDMKDSAYSGLYSEIAFIIGIAVIMIDTFFPPEETNANCVWKIILIAVSIVCMFYFAKKVKTVNEVEEEKKFWPNFFIQWATSLGYINMPVLIYYTRRCIYAQKKRAIDSPDGDNRLWYSSIDNDLPIL